MAPLIVLFGLLVLAVGLGLVVKPAARLKVPTRRRAAAVAVSGFVLFGVGAAMLPPPPAADELPASAVAELAPAAQPASSPEPEPAPPSITDERLGELIRSDPTMNTIFKNMEGGAAIGVQQDDPGTMTIGIEIIDRQDRSLAQPLGLKIAELAVKELVAIGANPRLTKRMIRVVVTGTTKSVTGGDLYFNYGRAVYFPGDDRIEWRT